MGSSFIQYLLNISVLVIILVLLIVISIKLNKSSLEKIGANKYTKVLERTPLNKESNVYVLKVGDEGCVIVSSSSNTTKIKDLSKEDVIQIEENIKNISCLNLSKFELNKSIAKFNIRKKRHG